MGKYEQGFETIRYFFSCKLERQSIVKVMEVLHCGRRRNRMPVSITEHNEIVSL